MKKPKFIIVPPMARIPQVPPQQVAGNRRVRLDPSFNRSSTSRASPVAGPHIPRLNRFLYLAPKSTRISTLQQQHSPARPLQKPVLSPEEHDVVIALPPLIKLPSNPPKMLWEQQGLDTPRSLSLVKRPAQLSTSKDMPRDFSPGTARSRGIPDTPPYSIPGYFPARSNGQEPGVGETLLGCAVLLVVSIIVLILLYYLSS
jgi:hypothetical protein